MEGHALQLFTKCLDLQSQEGFLKIIGPYVDLDFKVVS